jgi:hypothetical protein
MLSCLSCFSRKAFRLVSFPSHVKQFFVSASHNKDILTANAGKTPRKKETEKLHAGTRETKIISHEIWRQRGTFTKQPKSIKQAFRSQQCSDGISAGGNQRFPGEKKRRREFCRITSISYQSKRL